MDKPFMVVATHNRLGSDANLSGGDVIDITSTSATNLNFDVTDARNSAAAVSSHIYWLALGV